MTAVLEPTAPQYDPQRADASLRDAFRCSLGGMLESLGTEVDEADELTDKMLADVLCELETIKEVVRRTQTVLAAVSK